MSRPQTDALPLARASVRLRQLTQPGPRLAPKPQPSAYYLANRERIITRAQVHYKANRSMILDRQQGAYRADPGKFANRVQISRARRLARLIAFVQFLRSAA